MDQAAVQTDFETDLDTQLPPALTTLLEKLKEEGLYFEPNPSQEQKPQWLEDQAIEAVQDAIRHATLLMGSETNIAEAARHLERIQVAAAVSEKAAYITHTKRAKRCSEVIRQIAQQCRTYFHDMKASHRLLRKN